MRGAVVDFEGYAMHVCCAKLIIYDESYYVFVVLVVLFENAISVVLAYRYHIQ